jgi:divalent metal cation (Fe/Co/Zn/Cd) transporter
LQIEDRSGTDALPARIAAVRDLLTELAGAHGILREVHDVRVRETAHGEVVNFHCRADAALTVEAAHEAVDEVERALRRRAPAIKRVIGHAEPTRRS